MRRRLGQSSPRLALGSKGYPLIAKCRGCLHFVRSRRSDRGMLAVLHLDPVLLSAARMAAYSIVTASRPISRATSSSWLESCRSTAIASRSRHSSSDTAGIWPAGTSEGAGLIRLVWMISDIEFLHDPGAASTLSGCASKLRETNKFGELVAQTPG
jgi:hypothetical protein